MIKLDINKGDYILVGRFKNKRVEVKEISTDENGCPTVNGKNILKIRIEKLMKPKKNLKEAVNPSKTDNYQLYRLSSNSPSPGHGEYLYASANDLDTLFDNWILTMKRGGYGYEGSDLARVRKEFLADKLNYWRSGRGGSFYKLKVKKQIKESTMSLKDLEDYFHENESDIRDNMKTYGFKLKDISKIRNYMDLASVLGADSRDVKNVDLAQYASTLSDLLMQEQYKGKNMKKNLKEAILNKSNLNESKQFKLANIAKTKSINETIDYEDEIVAPSWLIRNREYVWIMGTAPLLVIYTGPGKKPGSKNFKFVDKPNVNHDLSVKDVREYIKYKEGDTPGPFGHDSDKTVMDKLGKIGVNESKQLKEYVDQNSLLYQSLMKLFLKERTKLKSFKLQYGIKAGDEYDHEGVSNTFVTAVTNLLNHPRGSSDLEIDLVNDMDHYLVCSVNELKKYILELIKNYKNTNESKQLKEYVDINLKKVPFKYDKVKKQIKESFDEVRITDWLKSNARSYEDKDLSEDDVDYLALKVQQKFNISDYNYNFIVATIKQYYGINESKQLSLAGIARKILKESEYKSKLDKQFKNDDNDLSIVKSDISKPDNSGPHATTATSVTKYIVISLYDQKYDKNDILNWAREIWKSSYMVDRRVDKVMKFKDSWTVTVTTTVWQN